jgi:hypothetical protein
MVRFKAVTEKDKENKEFAEKVSNDWIEQVKKISEENHLDIQKDFRKILTIIKKRKQIDE